MTTPATSGAVLVQDVVRRYVTFARAYYADDEGTHGRDVQLVLLATRRLNSFFGIESIEDFDALKLDELRAMWVADERPQELIAVLLAHVRRALRWAAMQGLVSEEAVGAIEEKPLPPHLREQMKTCGPRRVGLREISPCLPHLPRALRDVVKVLEMTGANAADILQMTEAGIGPPEDDVRIYRPPGAPPEHRVTLDAQTWHCIERWLRKDPDELLWTPVTSAERSERERGSLRRVGPRRACSRPPGPPYTIREVEEAVRRACRAARVQPWTLSMLGAATRVRRHPTPTHNAQAYRRLPG